jgi:hypothetical protein
MKKIVGFFLMVISFLIILHSTSFGYGVALSHYVGYPLNLNPGDSVQEPVILDNRSEDFDQWISMSVWDEQGTASFVDPHADGLWLIPANTLVTEYLNITIPNDNYLSDFIIHIETEQVNIPGSGAMISMGYGIGRYLPVHIDEPLPAAVPEPSNIALVCSGLVGLFTAGKLFGRRQG